MSYHVFNRILPPSPPPTDHISQIWDGKNVMDFVDEEIDGKLNQLVGFLFF